MVKVSNYLTTVQVCARYGGISSMTLHRWRCDENLLFPAPDVIRGRNYWRASELDEWDDFRKKIKASAERYGATVPA